MPRCSLSSAKIGNNCELTIKKLIIHNYSITLHTQNNNYMKIGIIIAMDKEFDRISAMLDNTAETIHGGRRYVT